MNPFNIVLIAGLLSGVDTPETIQPVSPFNHLDADANGVITRNEVRYIPKLYREYEEIDADASGTIDKIEFSAFELEVTD